MILDFTSLKNIRAGEGYFIGEVSSNTKHQTRYLKNNELCGRFLGINTFIDWIERNQETPELNPQSDYFDSSNTPKEQGEYGFYKFQDFKEAMHVFKNEPHTIADFKEKDDRINGGESSGLSVEYDVTGDFIDIDRVLEGVPETFGYTTGGNPRSKRVVIYNISTFSSDVQEERINHRSDRIKRFVDWLEMNNIRTQIVNIYSNDNAHVEIVIKDFDEPFSIYDVAISGNSDFYRRGIFAFREFSKTIGWGYGSPRDFWSSFDRRKFESEHNNEYSVIIGSGGMDSYSNARIDDAMDALEIKAQETIVDEYNRDILSAMEGFS